MLLDGVLPSLVCPVCQGLLHRVDAQVRCADGHSFDVARQGYLNLAVGVRAGTADTSDMVQARDRFLAAGHYRPLAERVAAAAGRRPGRAGLVLDLAGGTGYYLAAVLDTQPGRFGACLDLSTPALRRAARAHPRAAAIGADAWRRLPVADAAAAVVLNVFGPRDPDEIRRILAPDGMLVTASPAPHHLHEVIEAFDLIGVDPRKDERRTTAFAAFERLDTETWQARLLLTADAAADLVGMGPSAAHVGAPELARRVAALPAPIGVTAAVEVTTYALRRP